MPIGGQVIGSAILEMGVNTRAWANGLDTASAKFVSFGANVRVAAFRMGAIWAATVALFGAGVIKIGASFEKEFTGVRKTVQGTEEQFAKLRKELLETSVATTFTADQLAILARKGGQLGIQTENLAKFTETIAKLGLAAAELPAEEAAVGLSRLMAITGEAQTNVDILATVLARLGDSFATTESRILNFAVRIAGLSKVTNMTATDTLALSAAFTAVVPGVELVATQLSKGMAIFANAVASGGDKLKVLDELVAHTGRSFSTIFRVDAKTAITEFLQGLSNVNKEGGNVFQTLRDLGLTNQRAAQAFLALAGATDQVRKAIKTTNDELRKARTDQSKINRAFAEQMETFSAKWIVLWNNIKKIAIDVFEAFEKEIKDFLDTATVLVQKLESLVTWFEGLSSASRKAILAIAGGIGVLTAAAAGFGLLLTLGASLKPLLTGFKAVWALLTGAIVKNTAAMGANAVAATAAGQAHKAAAVSAGASTTGGFTYAVSGAAAGTAKGATAAAIGGFAKAGVVTAILVSLTQAAITVRKQLEILKEELGKLDKAFWQGTVSLDNFTNMFFRMAKATPGITGTALQSVAEAAMNLTGNLDDAARGTKILEDAFQTNLQQIKDTINETAAFEKATVGFTDAQRKMVDNLMFVGGYDVQRAASIVYQKEMGKNKKATEEFEAAQKRIQAQLSKWRIESAGGVATAAQEDLIKREQQEFIASMHRFAVEKSPASLLAETVPTSVALGIGDPSDPKITGFIKDQNDAHVKLWEDVQEGIDEAKKRQQQFNQALQNARNIASLIGGGIGQIAGNIIGAGPETLPVLLEVE
ncbi:MAG: phage tail tape measure protein [Candidatus Thorarchaeota archaeon]|jgi:TP901 family phage tail tape measure protein